MERELKAPPMAMEAASLGRRGERTVWAERKESSSEERAMQVTIRFMIGGSTGAAIYQLGGADAIPYAEKMTLKTEGAVSGDSTLAIVMMPTALRLP